MDRNQARSSLLAGPAKERVVKTVTVGGVDVELRAIPYGKRTRIMGKLDISAAELQDPPIDVLFRLKLEAVLACAHAPGDAQPLFGEADREELESQDSGGFIDELGDAAVGVLIGGVRSLEDAKKPSAETSAAASSSPSPSDGDKTHSSSPIATPTTI